MQPLNHRAIETLLDFEGKISDPLPGELRIAVFDFDHTLAKSEAYCASDHFNDFMDKTNRINQIFSNAHAPLLLKLREKVSYTACENSVEISRMIKRLEDNGWIPVILTARPKSMAALTQRNIREAKLPEIPLKNIIFASWPGKAVSLVKWLKKHPKWGSIKSLHVRFADDKTSYCDQMLKLPQLLKGIPTKVHTFHYRKALVTADMTQQQQRILVVQLSAFKQRVQIPKDEAAQTLDPTKDLEHLQLHHASWGKDDLYKMIKRIAEEEGVPLDGCSTRLKKHLDPSQSSIIKTLRQFDPRILKMAGTIAMGAVVWMGLGYFSKTGDS